MNNLEQVITLLTEELCNDVVKFPKCSVFFDRLLIRISTSPALLSSLAEYGLVETSNGVTIQLGFNRVPAEVVPTIENLIAPPAGTKVRIYEYVKENQARIGFELTLVESKLGGDAFHNAA